MLDDPDVSCIVLMTDAQRGKTTIIIVGILSRCELDPAPMMLVAPDQDSIRELRDKVYSTGLETDTLRDRIPPQRLWNDRLIDLMTMHVYLAFSGSRQRLRGRTCKSVYCTEVDVWQDSPRLGKSAELIRARTKAFPEHKIVYESTPTDEASTIDAMYKRTDQRKFHVPCPHCGQYQELRFFVYKSGKHAGRAGLAGLQDEHGSWLAAEEVRRKAHYLCINGCTIDSSDKLRMLAKGKWVPRGQFVDEHGHLRGKPARSRRRVGYHLSALYDEQVSFGEVAAEYVQARESHSLREFFNNWLGLPFTSGSVMPKWKVLGRKLAAHHPRGVVPAEAWFLEASADVQADRVYWRVRAWGDACTSWLVDWGVLNRDQQHPYLPDGLLASDLAQLDEHVLKVHWPVDGENPRGQSSMRVRVLGIDANHRTSDVHAYLRAHPDGRVRAVRGDHKVDPAMGYRMNVVERNARTGEVYDGGLELWGIFVNVYKEDLLMRFQIDAQQAGAFLFPADILEEGQEYLRQLVNEGPVTVINKIGRQVRTWLTRDKELGEHYWDLEVYGRCLAEMVTGGIWEAEIWRKKWPSVRPAPDSAEVQPIERAVHARGGDEVIVFPRA
jgi:phage terminase large subunit GpA-like protein